MDARDGTTIKGPGALPPAATGGASLSDILTAIKNLVTALNGASQAYIHVNGQSSTEGITSPVVVKGSPGRIASVSVIVAGSNLGHCYDSATLGVFTAPLCVIPNTVGVFVINIATDSGLLVVPGSGQTVTVSWS